jgi:hypothetical protein
MTTATALTLDRGTHDTAEEGACLLELVSLLAGEEFSDAPRCVSPVLANAGRAWNDSLGDEERQRLLGYADRLLGTADAAAADPLGALDAVAPALRPIHDSMWELFERLVTGPRRTGVDGGETEREVDAVRRHRP